MKILAIDSSGLVASVAVTEDDNLIAEYTTNYKKTHSQTLLPMLDEVKKMIELDLNTIDAIAVSAGPGSFTGLRIGSATAKGLGLALNKPLIGVPTVDALAMNLYGTDQIICPLMDARRSQVYTGIYRFVQESGNEAAAPASLPDAAQAQAFGEVSYSLKVREPQCVVPIEEMAEPAAGSRRRDLFRGWGTCFPFEAGGINAPSLFLCPGSVQQTARLCSRGISRRVCKRRENGIGGCFCPGISSSLPGGKRTKRGPEISRSPGR